MFFSQSEAILCRVRDHLTAWRAHGASAERLAALQSEFDALESGAAQAGFDDVAELGNRVAKLLGQSGEVADADDVSLLNLLEEVHDGLVADIGFVPSETREQIKTLIGLVALLLHDAPPATSAPDVPMHTFGEGLSQLRGIVEVAEGKQVELNFSGDAVEAEQPVIERVTKLLERMIRHTIAHRIHSAEQRTACGKDAVAHINIAITVPQTRTHILVDYSDDGEALHDADHDQEAMRDDIKKLGGLMAMKSAEDGSVGFQFGLPAVIDTHRALLVMIGEYRFALPAHIIELVIRVAAEEVITHEQRKYISIAGRRIPIIDQTAIIGARDSSHAQPMTLLVLLRLADRFAAVEVDAVHDLIELTPKNAGAQLASIRGIAGVAPITRSSGSADSSLALILDPDAFIHREVLERDRLTLFPLCETQPNTSPEKTMRVVVLETSRQPLVIPATMVAEVISTTQPAMHEHEPGHEHEWIGGAVEWRGFTVPVINAAVFANDDAADADDTDAADAGSNQTKHRKYAVILLPMKHRQPDEFFALSSFAAPSVIEIDDQPAAAPTDTGQPPKHLLGYVQLKQRLGLVPDLHTLAHGIFHDR